MLPPMDLPSEDMNDWMVMNTVECYNALSISYGLVAEDAAKMSTEPGTGFPPGFEYRWKDGVGIKTPIKCTGHEYVQYVFAWTVDSAFEVFPTLDDQPFPEKLMPHIRNIMKRLFRIYAILYHQFWNSFKRLGADIYLETSFKQFMFFTFEFKLVEPNELKALGTTTKSLYEEFKKAKMALKDK